MKYMQKDLDTKCKGIDLLRRLCGSCCIFFTVNKKYIVMCASPPPHSRYDVKSNNISMDTAAVHDVQQKGFSINY